MYKRFFLTGLMFLGITVLTYPGLLGKEKAGDWLVVIGPAGNPYHDVKKSKEKDKDQDDLLDESFEKREPKRLHQSDDFKEKLKDRLGKYRRRVNLKDQIERLGNGRKNKRNG